MEENPSGSLPPAPSLSDETVRMARVLPLSAVGVTNHPSPEAADRWLVDARITDEGLPPFDPDQPIGPRNFPEVSTVRGGIRFTGSPGTPVGRVRVEEDEHGVRGVPLEDDPEEGTPDWWDDAVRTYQELEPIVLEPVEGTLLEGTAGTDPFILWCRRILHALWLVAATAGTIAWLLILFPIVRIVWSELWF